MIADAKTWFEASILSSLDQLAKPTKGWGEPMVLVAYQGETILVPERQAWFWTEEWQLMESEADAELDAGEYEIYDDMDDFIASLDD